MKTIKFTLMALLVAAAMPIVSCGGNQSQATDQESQAKYQKSQVTVQESQATELAKLATPELKKATDPLKDGHYKAEWTYKGQWYAVEYVLQNKAIRSAKFIEQNESYELKCKLAHQEDIKAIRLDKSEDEFYFQFNINSLTGYMQYPAEHDIQVTIYEL